MENSEFAANPEVPPAEHIREWADVKTDPIDVEQAGPSLAGRGRADAARRVEVAGAPPPALAGWTLAGLPSRRSSLAPLIALPALVRRAGRGLDSDRGEPAAAMRCAASLVLARGCRRGTLLLGGGLAALVSFYDFPGRRWLDWALVLPLAMPAYVLVFVLLGQYDEAGPLQRAVRDMLGLQLPTCVRRSARSPCSRSCSTRTSTCSRAARSSASRGRRSRLRARSGSRTPPRCGGLRSRSRGRRWRAAWRWR